MAKKKETYSLISVDVAPEEEVVRVDAHGVHRGISSDPQDASSQLDGKPWRSDLASSSEEGFSSLNAVALFKIKFEHICRRQTANTLLVIEERCPSILWRLPLLYLRVW